MTPSHDRRIGDLVVTAGPPAVAYYPPGTSDGPRIPDRLEFLWMLQGVADWTYGAERLPLSPGMLALLRPGVQHRFTFDPRRPTRVGYVRFTVDQERCDPLAWPAMRIPSRDDPLRGLTRYLLWLGSQQPEGWQIRVRDIVAMLVTVFVHGPLPNAPEGPDLPPALDPILEHVRAAWSAGPLRPLTRTELARAGAMSPGHLSRLFREHCGVGAVAAFELLRLMRAESLLRRSNMSVRSIASACGFADAYHFSHRFKAAYGVSPRTFRDGADAVRAEEDSTRMVRLLAHRIWGASGPMQPAMTSSQPGPGQLP